MTETRLIPYPEERALEDAAYARGAMPTRLFHLLLPVWRVEIRATITEAEPYDLIDYYLERGIAEGGLHIPADLAEFFSLDEALVDRALRVLSRIGHVRVTDGRVSLTEIGERSVRDKWRYTVKRQDHRELYFDGFGSRPLTRPYYDPSTVTLLSGQELLDVVNRRGWPAFRMIVSLRAFRDEAVAELAAQADRDRFNLPARIDAPERVAPSEPVYLPAYLVRAVTPDGRARHLVYTQAAGAVDEDITGIYERSPDLGQVIENEEAVARDGRDETRAREWLRKRGQDRLRPVRRPNGTLRVTFPPSCFDAKGPVPLSKLGSFVVLGNDFFHVWCDDERVRRRALLERVGFFLGARTSIRRSDLGARVARVGRQVGLGEVGLAELRAMAVRAGMRDLVSLLDEVSTSGRNRESRS
ncbi:MAG: hypothetical protein ACRDNL_11705 [Spirillospora sp.]